MPHRDDDARPGGGTRSRRCPWGRWRGRRAPVGRGGVAALVPVPPSPSPPARSVPPGPAMESSGVQSCPATCLAFSRTHKGLVLIGEIVRHGGRRVGHRGGVPGCGPSGVSTGGTHRDTSGSGSGRASSGMPGPCWRGQGASVPGSFGEGGHAWALIRGAGGSVSPGLGGAGCLGSPLWGPGGTPTRGSPCPWRAAGAGWRDAGFAGVPALKVIGGTAAPGSPLGEQRDTGSPPGDARFPERSRSAGAGTCSPGVTRPQCPPCRGTPQAPLPPRLPVPFGRVEGQQPPARRAPPTPSPLDGWGSVPEDWRSPESLGVPGGKPWRWGVPRRLGGSLRGPMCAPQDFTRCVTGALLFLITSLIVLLSHHDGAGIAGGVFGILAGILLGYDAYITFPLRQRHTAAPSESPDGA
ncbi:collagen alpha-1(III) chain-like [Pyrgilauda ruficollis]|uniref:collagen alpha-1(III) chain-like n=1 Tax=Pyrgilauda ruficollis TaxID=221976 RepID=UPI001B8633C3|nr:collagen alpha-1(III) chain-like [Pyrgilauda ruficollis]